MKSILGLALTGLLFATAAQAAPKTYALACRGGGDTTLGTSTSPASLIFYFQRGTKPAGQGLLPGQCSWLDRGVGAAEPNCVRQYNVEATAWISPTGTGSPKEPYVFSNSLKWPRRMGDSNYFVTFTVYNDGQCMRAQSYY